MKKLVFVCVGLMSITAFANQNISEFERGYNAGAAGCMSEVWTCSAMCRVSPTAEEEFVTFGYTRAQAVMELLKRPAGVLSSTNNCSELAMTGKVKCSKVTGF